MKTPNIQVIGARVVLRQDKPEEQTAGGIILPTKAQEETLTGTVVVVGDGQRLDNGAFFPLNVQVGDRVLYMRTAGIPVEYEGEEYLVINESHILAIFPGEGK